MIIFMFYSPLFDIYTVSSGFTPELVISAQIYRRLEACDYHDSVPRTVGSGFMPELVISAQIYRRLEACGYHDSIP